MESRIYKEYEVYILTGDYGRVGTKGEKGKQYTLPILAYVIKSTGDLVKSTGETLRDKIKINWDEEQNFEFEKQTIYLLKCKASVLAENEANATPKRLIVEDVLEAGVENEQLRAMLEEYKTPIIKNDEKLGKFVLDKRFNCFESNLKLLGRECKISLNVDDANDFDVCIEFLRRIYDNIEEFDNKAKAFIVEKLLDAAIEWNDDEAVSEEEFISTLSLYDLCISKRGLISLYYSCGDIFLGHVICVRGNVEGRLKEAVIEG